jgi:hypothetical protein
MFSLAKGKDATYKAPRCQPPFAFPNGLVFYSSQAFPNGLACVPRQLHLLWPGLS